MTFLTIISSVKQALNTAYSFCHFAVNTLWGFIQLSRLSYPRVTIFGWSRQSLDDRYAQQAHKLAELLVRNKIAILTGGGSGIMQAGILGATHEQKRMSLGVGARSISELCGKDVCVKNYVEMDYLFSRKWILINKSQAFVAFPGGFGTLNEIAEVLTFIQKGVLTKSPLILIGKKYWQPLIAWIEQSAIPYGLVASNSLELIQVTDDVDAAAQVVIDFCQRLSINKSS